MASWGVVVAIFVFTQIFYVMVIQILYVSKIPGLTAYLLEPRVLHRLGKIFPALQWFNYICRNPLPHILLPFICHYQFLHWWQAGIFQRGKAMHCVFCIEVCSLPWGQGGKELLIPCCRYPSQAGQKRTSCYVCSKQILPLHPLIKTVPVSSNKTLLEVCLWIFFPFKSLWTW